MRFDDKTIFLVATKFSTGKIGSAFKLCKVELVNIEVFAFFRLHIFDSV